MRRALIVGINYYKHGKPLFGCVDDARAVNKVLARHGDDDATKNFDTTLLEGIDINTAVSRRQVKDEIQELFSRDLNDALFYFAGHGYVETAGGYLLTSDAGRGDEGVSLSEVLTFANASPARNKLIILDSCHSGIAGTPPEEEALASLAEGLTILTASSKDQYATEENGRGLFTTLLVDALNGGAANLTGAITPGSIYAHIDQSLGTKEQRPIFKANVKNFVSLRKVEPPIPPRDLRRIADLFPEPGYKFQVDPTFEKEMKGRDPGMPDPIPENTEKFAILQQYNRLNLLVPVDAPHMWHAAMKSKSCKLTALGEHYRRLVVRDRL